MINTKELFDAIPVGQWVEKEKNIWALKRAEAFGLIYPNVSSYEVVSEWQSDVYRLVHGVRIEGRSIKSPDLDKCKKFIDQEMFYLLGIQCPYRDVG